MMEKIHFKMTETLAYGTHLRVLSESYPMNTKMTGFRCFSKILASLYPSEESSFCIGMVITSYPKEMRMIRILCVFQVLVRQLTLSVVMMGVMRRLTPACR